MCLHCPLFELLEALCFQPVRSCACVRASGGFLRPPCSRSVWLCLVQKYLCINLSLQYFDAIGFVAGRASGLQKTEWWGVGVVTCLELGAVLHMVQLMPLPLNVSCFCKIQIGFTFLIPAHPGSPRKRAVKLKYVESFFTVKFALCTVKIMACWTILTRKCVLFVCRSVVVVIDRFCLEYFQL